MSSSTRPSWRKTVEQQLEENSKFVTYALATLSPSGEPKVRHVIHRGISPSGMFLTTTDTRMQKPVHLAAHHGVEVAWWIDPSAIQFRFSGEAYTIPAQHDKAGSSAVEKVLGALKLAESGGEDASAQWWEEKRMELWEKGMSGHLRASFARPTPGKPLDEVDSKPEEWPESLPPTSDDPEEQKVIDTALEHFAILAIRPTAFEVLELKPTPNIRTQYSLQSDGKWKEVSVAP